MRYCTLFLLPLIAVLGVAERDEPNPDAWPSLMACAAFESPSSRLDCYDKVLPPKKPREKGEKVNVTSRVAEILVIGWNKRRSLVLENGQRWDIRQDRGLSVEVGDAIELRQGAVTSTNVYLNGRYLGKGKLYSPR